MKVIKGVGVFVKRKDKLLAVKRTKEDKIFGGMWAFPGGQIENGENLLQAAKREIKEETGLELISLEKNACLKGRLNIPGLPPILILVHRGEVSDDKLIPYDDDIEKVAWIKAKDLLDSLKKNNYSPKEIKKLEKFLALEKLIRL